MRGLAYLLKDVRPVSTELAPAAQARLDHLTKPLGSLGRLESIARSLVCLYGRMDIRIRRKVIFTFAADHGIAEESVSLYPRSVTGQMVQNFLSGGAAVNVLARQAGADLCIVDAGILEPVASSSGKLKLVQKRIGPGTKNFLNEDAMSRREAVRAIESGADVFFEEYKKNAIDVAGVGDMGIGNSSSAAAMLSVFLNRPPKDIAGRGTGLDDEGLERKAAVIGRALHGRKPDANDPVDVLAKVGGFEIGEMAGCFLAGAARRTAVLVDGFISTAAAVLAIRLCPAVRDYLFFSHRSAEGGHALALTDLGVNPLIDLGMRLGEGTGAAMGMHVLDCAAAIFGEMATFDSAGVSKSGVVKPA